MRILGEENFQDICCNSMITALQKEVFWVEQREKDLVFGFENIKWNNLIEEWEALDFVVVEYCPFCGKKVEVKPL